MCVYVRCTILTATTTTGPCVFACMSIGAENESRSRHRQDDTSCLITWPPDGHFSSSSLAKLLFVHDITHLRLPARPPSSYQLTHTCTATTTTTADDDVSVISRLPSMYVLVDLVGGLAWSVTRVCSSRKDRVKKRMKNRFATASNNLLKHFTSVSILTKHISSLTQTTFYFNNKCCN